MLVPFVWWNILTNIPANLELSSVSKAYAKEVSTPLIVTFVLASSVFVLIVVRLWLYVFTICIPKSSSNNFEYIGMLMLKIESSDILWDV